MIVANSCKPRALIRHQREREPQLMCLAMEIVIFRKVLLLQKVSKKRPPMGSTRNKLLASLQEGDLQVDHPESIHQIIP